MKTIIILIFIILSTAITAFAVDIDTGELYGAISGDAANLLHDISPLDTIRWQTTFNNLLGAAGNELGGGIRTALGGFLIIVAIIIICGMVGGLREGEDVNGHDFVLTAGALGIGVTVLVQVNGLLSVASRALEQLTTFSNVLLPAMTTASIASGQPAAAIAKSSAAVLFGSILMNLFQVVLLPLVYGFIALSVANAALGHDSLGKMAQLLRWLASRLLIIFLSTYTLFLSLSGILAGAGDNLALRGTKAAINVVPVVGTIISGAAETVIVGASMVRAGIGVFGLLAMIAVMLAPFMQMTAAFLVYKIGAAVAPVVSDSKLGTLVNDIGAAFGLILGMAAAAIFVNFISVLAMMVR